MPDDIAGYCAHCGNLFLHGEGETLCRKCRVELDDSVTLIYDAVDLHGCKTPESIAEATGIPAERVRELIRENQLLRNTIDLSEPCRRCGEASAQTGSEFCLDCRAELNLALGDALQHAMTSLQAHQLSERQKDAAAEIAEKFRRRRERRRARGLDPSPHNRWSR